MQNGKSGISPVAAIAIIVVVVIVIAGIGYKLMSGSSNRIEDKTTTFQKPQRPNGPPPGVNMGGRPTTGGDTSTPAGQSPDTSTAPATR